MSDRFAKASGGHEVGLSMPYIPGYRQSRLGHLEVRLIWLSGASRVRISNLKKMNILIGSLPARRRQFITALKKGMKTGKI